MCNEMTMDFDCPGGTCSITLCADAKPDANGNLVAGPVSAVDWQKWLQIAACVATCIANSNANATPTLNSTGGAAK